MRRFDSRQYRRGLYLDKDNAWLFGVCSGLADKFGADVTIVRLIAVLVGVFWTLAAVVAYGVAAWLLDDRPLARPDRAKEREFWRRHSEDRSY